MNEYDKVSEELGIIASDREQQIRNKQNSRDGTDDESYLLSVVDNLRQRLGEKYLKEILKIEE